MKLLVAGGTGFIGAPLVRALTQHGHEVTVVTRSPDRHRPAERLQFVSWKGEAWGCRLAEADGIVNLAGESIAAGRWTARRKLALQESRLQTTRRLVDAMASGSTRPACLVNASAIGYYGARGDEPLDEHAPPGRGFLAELCRAWEAEARRAEPLGIRVVMMRIGLVLGPGGGALARMIPPFQWGIGGPLGSGRQWMSWVHRDDVIGMMEWALAHPEVSGPGNATAPQPVTMRAFCSALGRVLRRPSWAPVPAVALRLLLGEMAEVILSGQRGLPRAALDRGYAFRYAELEPALRACLAPSSQIP